jgi:hypothetical protein
MRVTNGSAVSTASTPPDLMISDMVGKVTSTKLTLLGSTPFSTSHFTNSTCRKAFRPGARLSCRRNPRLLDGDAVADEGRDIAARGRVHDRRAGDGDEVEAAVDGLQEHGRGRPPIWIEFERIAAGMFELMPIGVISTSSPCFLKMPSSTATIRRRNPMWPCSRPVSWLARKPFPSAPG